MAHHKEDCSRHNHLCRAQLEIHLIATIIVNLRTAATYGIVQWIQECMTADFMTIMMIVTEVMTGQARHAPAAAPSRQSL